MITAVFILSLLTAVFTVVLLVMFSVRKNDSMEESFRTMSGKLEENMNNSMSRMKQELNASTAGSMETLESFSPKARASQPSFSRKTFSFWEILFPHSSDSLKNG